MSKEEMVPVRCKSIVFVSAPFEDKWKKLFASSKDFEIVVDPEKDPRDGTAIYLDLDVNDEVINSGMLDLV